MSWGLSLCCKSKSLKPLFLEDEADSSKRYKERLFALKLESFFSFIIIPLAILILYYLYRCYS